MGSVLDEFKKVEQKDDFTNVKIEKVKKYWNDRPCNLRHSLKEIGTKEYFDEVEARKYKVEPHIPSFAEFSKWKGKKVLEVGCGLGTESINFARAGALITCVDLTEKSIELVKKRFEVNNLSGNFYCANAEKLSEVLNDSYDLIWSFGVIHHSPNPDKCLSEMYKLLKPEGEIRIMVYSKVSYKLFFLMNQTDDWDFSKIDSIISEYSEAQTGCPVTYSYTISEAKELMEKAGFKVNKIEKDHIFSFRIPEYVKYEYVKDEPWKNISDEQFHALEKELGWHTLIWCSKRI
jgi:2-polyprenyl-3-methyl-5-hydroxy-6-metoxy-1,4-benzoquinol methylase